METTEILQEGVEFLKFLKESCELLGLEIYVMTEPLYRALWKIGNPGKDYNTVVAILERSGYVKRTDGELLGNPITGIGLTQEGLEYISQIN